MKAPLFLRPLLTVAALCTGLPATAGSPADLPAGNPVTRWNAVAIQVLPVDPGLVMDSRAFAYASSPCTRISRSASSRTTFEAITVPVPFPYGCPYCNGIL